MDTSFRAIDTTKIAQTPLPPVVDTNAIKAAAKAKDISAYAPFWNHSFSYSTFSGKAKMFYQGKGDKQEFTANFRIKKDSVIWIAVTALGGVVQVARVYITPDSFFLVNYLQKEVYKMPLADAAKVLPAPVDFKVLQNMILGEPLRKSGDILDATAANDTVSLLINDQTYIQRVGYGKADSNLYSYHMNMQDPNGPQGNIQLGNYDVADGRRFSTFRSIVINNAGDIYYLDMNFTNYNFDQQPLELPFSIPSKYTLK